MNRLTRTLCILSIYPPITLGDGRTTHFKPTSPRRSGKINQTCAACHGPDGNSTVPNWPKLAGQWDDYLVKQLVAYRQGEKGPRYEPSMSAIVAPLSDQDIHDLAAFYASQTQTTGKTDPALLTLGEKIYRGGDLEHGVTACVACHAPDGSGIRQLNFLALAVSMRYILKINSVLFVKVNGTIARMA